MANKTKTTKSTIDQITDVTQSAGLLLMTAAVTLGMVEIPRHENSKIVVPNQPAFANVGDSVETNSTLRREKEEHGPHFVSYTMIQRTPSRTGKA